MNARPYIFGCLCLVGATGTAAATDIDLTGGLLSMSGAVSSSSFEGGGSRAGQGGRDSNAGADLGGASRSSAVSPRSAGPAPVPGPVDADTDLRDGSSSRSSTPSWQSMLPGSIF